MPSTWNKKDQSAMNLRFKVSLVWALSVSLLMLTASLIFLSVVREKRVRELEKHSHSIAQQIANYPLILQFANQPSISQNSQKIEDYLQALIQESPFIEELSLLDRRFGKMPFHVSQPREEQKKEIPRTAFSLNEILSNGKPFLSENSWEYFIPFKVSSSYSAVLRMRWKPEATWKFFHQLKYGMVYLILLCFTASFLISYIVMTRTYTNEQTRLAKTLNLIANGDLSNRVDTQSFSKGLSQIGVCLNRILSEMEQERKTTTILDDTLRQTEKNCHEYKSALQFKERELHNIKNELREGLIELFDMIWCGIAIIDKDFNIHTINEKAERLLRFAKIDDSVIVDERLKQCLLPLIRHNTKQRIDDLCVWPNTSLQRPVSCRIRAARIPTTDSIPLYFLLMQEESGYPQHLASTTFLEKLMLDCYPYETQEEVSRDDRTQLIVERSGHFRDCLRRIESMRNLENGNVDPSRSIRVPQWLRNHFQSEDLFSNYLHIDSNTPNADIQLFIPETILSELVDSFITILSSFEIARSAHNQLPTITLRAMVDAQGKPVLNVIIPLHSRKQANDLRDLLEERTTFYCERNGESPLTIEELEQDISLSMFRIITRLLRLRIECIYTENKQIASIRLTFEQPSFPQQQEADQAASSSNTVQELMRNYLSQ